MPHPKKKGTKSRAGLRGSHTAVKKQSLATCSNCGATLLPHRACAKCGYYKGEKKVK